MIPRVTANKVSLSPILLPDAFWEFNGDVRGRTKNGIIEGTYSRASAGTENWNGTIHTQPSGTPRFQSISDMLGILIEGARTNYFLNSGTPATHTSPSLGIDTYTLWIPDGTSVAVAANTATGTGFGTATPGSPVTFSITGAGTVDFTVVGSPTYAQCENGSSPSSYIVTAGSAVSRASDSLSCALGSWFSATEGTLLTTLYLPSLQPTGNFPRIIAVSTGALANRIVLNYSGASQALNIAVVDGGVAQVSGAGSTTVPTGSFVKVAMAWKLNDFAVYMNGTQEYTSNSGTLPTSLTTMYIGQKEDGTGSELLYGNEKNTTYWAYRLSNTELASITA